MKEGVLKDTNKSDNGNKYQSKEKLKKNCHWNPKNEGSKTLATFYFDEAENCSFNKKIITRNTRQPVTYRGGNF